MFSMIITLVGIVLVALLAVATIYYGGSVFESAPSSASVSGMLAESQQIQAAMQMYQANTGSMPTGSSEDIKSALLTGNYLSAWPKSVDWNFVDGYVTASNISEPQCLAFNKKKNLDLIPSCADVTESMGAVCCDE